MIFTPGKKVKFTDPKTAATKLQTVVDNGGNEVQRHRHGLRLRKLGLCQRKQLWPGHTFVRALTSHQEHGTHSGASVERYLGAETSNPYF